MNKIVLGGLTGGVLVPVAAITLFTSVIVPRLSTSQISTAYCLPTTSGTVTSDKQTPLATPNALGAGAGETTAVMACIGNTVIVQAALAIVAHLHGDPDVNWDAQMPPKALAYWAALCPAGSSCWIDWQSGTFQCVTLVTGTYALAGAPLPATGNAIDFWSLYAHRPGWSEIPSFVAPTGQPRHLPLPGDIMVWWNPPPNVGHVAIVTAVIPPTNGGNGSITFAQANGPGSVVGGQFIPGIVTQMLTPDLSVLTWSTYQVYGFIRPNSVYVDLAAQDALVAGIPGVLFQRQIKVESHFNPDAISPSGAVGIAQFMPATAASLNPPLDPTDPVASLAAAAQYMASKARTFGGDYAKALAAYNAGEEAVKAAVATYGANWLQHMPSETITYVQSIMGY